MDASKGTTTSNVPRISKQELREIKREQQEILKAEESIRNLLFLVGQCLLDCIQYPNSSEDLRELAEHLGLYVAEKRWTA